MKPISFKEKNVVYAEDQPQYIPLPAYKHNNPEGEVVSCWGLSFKERLKVLFTGKIWLSLWSFNKPLTPSRLTTRKEEVLPQSN